MPRLLDAILVVDLEATCWEDDPPQGEQSEIIEVGACLLDIRTGEIIKNEGILVRPVQSSVSKFCTKLTTLTPEMVRAGVPFETACKKLRKEWRSRDRVWASFGNYDRRQFERQCEQTEVPYPFGPDHLNVKTMFALMQPLGREVGMSEALDRVGLPLTGTHHRGIDDARNIATLLWHLLASSRGEASGAANGTG